MPIMGWGGGLHVLIRKLRPMQNVVHLREFGEQLVAGRNVQAHFLDLVVYLDSSLVSLILGPAGAAGYFHLFFHCFSLFGYLCQASA